MKMTQNITKEFCEYFVFDKEGVPWQGDCAQIGCYTLHDNKTIYDYNYHKNILTYSVLQLHFDSFP